MSKQWFMSAAIVAAAIAAGCSESPQRSGSASTPVSPTPAPVTLTPVDRAAFDAEVAKHRGKVVLVDFWATWCLPCVEQLPHTLELGRKHADRGLAVVTVSCDEKAEADRVAGFLGGQKAGVATNLISEFGGSPATMENFEIDGGAVPFYKLYDRKGELRQTFGVTTSSEIDQAVEKLLAE